MRIANEKYIKIEAKKKRKKEDKKSRRANSFEMKFNDINNQIKDEFNDEFNDGPEDRFSKKEELKQYDECREARWSKIESIRSSVRIKYNGREQLPSDFGEIIIRQKAKCEGNIASSSDNSMDSVQLFTSSDKEVVEGTNSIDKEAPINKIPLKFQNRGKNIQEKRKGLFTYKPFKEDLQPVINPRIELEKRNVTENSNKICKISCKFSINNGISDIEPIEFELKDKRNIDEINKITAKIMEIKSKNKRKKAIEAYSSLVSKFQKCMLHLHFIRNTMIKKPKDKRNENDNKIIDFVLIYDAMTPEMHFYKIENLPCIITFKLKFIIDI